jgi:hypothetical protein
VNAVLLEGLENVLSILHSDVERQLPRDYAEFETMATSSDVRKQLTTNGMRAKCGQELPW